MYPAPQVFRYTADNRLVKYTPLASKGVDKWRCPGAVAPRRERIVLHCASVIIADQSPQLQHEVIRSNIGTKIIFRLGGSAADSFKTELGLSEQHRTEIMNLPDHVAVLKRPDIPFPFLARVPNFYTDQRGSGSSMIADEDEINAAKKQRWPD